MPNTCDGQCNSYGHSEGCGEKEGGWPAQKIVQLTAEIESLRARLARSVPDEPPTLQELDPEARRILYANLWNLYDGEAPKDAQARSADPRLEEIRKRLEQATPGEWGMYDGWGPSHADGKHRCARIGTDERPVFSPAGVYGATDLIGRKEDFEFVAHAAADIAYLLEKVGSPTDKERLDWLACHSPMGQDGRPLTSLHRGQIDALMRARPVGEPEGETRNVEREERLDYLMWVLGKGRHDQ